MTTYADGAKATVQVASAVNTSQSGLTPGAKYYVQEDGTLSITPDTPHSVLAGTAISATKLLVSSSLITAHPDPELPAAGAAGTILKSDGTNWISGDEAELPTPGIAGYVLKSDGSNWIAGAEAALRHAGSSRPRRGKALRLSTQLQHPKPRDDVRLLQPAFEARIRNDYRVGFPAAGQRRSDSARYRSRSHSGQCADSGS